MKNKRLWITPSNDLEAKTIIEMLERNEEEYLVTGQAWGASWENLEEEIKKSIEEAKENGKEIYGVELQGDSKGAINVDHHIYGEDDRSNPNSSIEQVGKILGVDLSIDEQFVAANDKGFIPAMEKLAAELGLSAEDSQEIIANIRMRDRQMQGVTLEMETQAQEAVDALGEITEKRDYIQVDLPHSKTSTITDRLYGKYDNLLITSGDGETNFFGTTEIIQTLNERFPGGWSGGQLDEGSGFWGGHADQESIKAVVNECIQERAKDAKDVKDVVEEYNPMVKQLLAKCTDEFLVGTSNPDKRKVGGKISHYFLPSGLHVYKNDIDEQFIICESDDVDIDDNGRTKEFVHVSDKPMGVFGDCVPVNGKVICGGISYQNGISDVILYQSKKSGRKIFETRTSEELEVDADTKMLNGKRKSKFIRTEQIDENGRISFDGKSSDFIVQFSGVMNKIKSEIEHEREDR